MSLFLKKMTPEAALGVWEISESVEELYAAVKLSAHEKKYYKYLK